MDSLPIGDYALLSDCRSAALVSRDGSVDWLCFPRFDGPSVFCRLLDPAGGRFAIRPSGEFQASRRYVDQTMVLETTFTTEGGTAVLTDALAVGRNERGHGLGARSPGILLRRLACTGGEIEAEVSYAPRPEYGLVHPILVPVPGGLDARGGADRLLLSASVSFDVDGATATGRIQLAAGQAAVFALGHGLRTAPPLAPWTPEAITARLDDTVEGWRSWSALHQTYEGPWRELVLHSGRVLQALTFASTGAIVAAPTTSLPETVGGERNWDYRYTWVRDASLTMDALWVAACPNEAGKFFTFLADAAASQLQSAMDLQIMFGVGGERDLSERELPHLAGWRDSRPVRVGNGAWLQRQLDVYGELLLAAQRLVDQLGELNPVTRRFLAAAADTAAARWREKDQGIWEIHGEPRDFLYSKLMCWVALDRAIALARHLDAEDRVTDWAAGRDEIRAAILERGWNERAGAFTQAFGSEDLDASNLMLVITGFLAGDDPRMKATIDATAKRLTDKRGLVYRYLGHDGLSGEEGTFLLCTFWLAQAQALAGEAEAATATFERALAAINDVGLLAEEVDSRSGEMIGNFPQAFSHIGLVNAAWAITQARQDANLTQAPATGSGGAQNGSLPVGRGPRRRPRAAGMRRSAGRPRGHPLWSSTRPSPRTAVWPLASAALLTSSPMRSRLIAAPAARPAAAAVMTCAWMSAVLPATHTPGTAVAPVTSVSIRVPTTCSPIRTSAGFRPSGASSSARAVMRGATTTASSVTQRPSASRTPVRPLASASICSTLPSVTVIPRASSCARCSSAGKGPVCCSSVTCGLSCRNSSAWWMAVGPVARMPMHLSLTSQPWQ
jgi:alpha,alpha-trehalase